jgi:PhoPQ-activated pathogenicity-related protein
VQRQDDSFTWEIVEERTLERGQHYFHVALTSQTWKGLTWTHRFKIVAPARYRQSSTKALLLIGGGQLGKARDQNDVLKYGVQVSESTGSPVALLYDVPNQPLFGGLTEDRLLAETFERYRQSGDRDWPIIFPMVKSAVRAIDCLEKLLQERMQLDLSGVVVAGASKRGWTTWLMPVVDERVAGIVPMVYDNLFIEKQLDHQIESWGEYSEMISAYTDKDFPQKLKDKDPELLKLVEMIDPYVYREAIDVPKLIVLGTNDLFWSLDALNVYIDDLKGENYIYYAANAGHSLNRDRELMVSTASSFFKYIDEQVPFYPISASFTRTGERVAVEVKAGGQPWEVLLMSAVSDTKDFRAAEWKESSMSKRGRKFSSVVRLPKGKHLALYGQAVYSVDGDEVLRSTRLEILSSGLQGSAGVSFSPQ